MFSTHSREIKTACKSPLPLSPPLLNSMGATARVVVATGGSAARNYSMTVFTGWDYGSMDQTATILKQKNIHYQLQVRGQRGSSAWRRAVWRLSDDSRTLFLTGGSGRAAAKGKGSCSDSASESCLILPPGSYVSSVYDAHWSGPLLHRLGFKLQPGECREGRVVKAVWRRVWRI